VKSPESFLEKAARKGYKEPLSETEDICGFRVICLFKSDIARLADLVRSCLEVTSDEDKETELVVDLFGYMGRHLIVSLPSNYVGPRYQDLKGIKAEVQIRTIAMDAWANVSHYLEYKTPEAAPSALRKDFYALSGLFYLADVHFELFFQDQKQSREQTNKISQTLGGVLTQELNLDTFMAYIKLSSLSTVNASFRDPPDLGDVSGLVSEILQAGYKTVGDLHRMLLRAEPAFKELEWDEITEHAADGFPLVEAIRISLGLVDKRFECYLSYWDRDDYAHLILPA
jgi:ppGpp synthetase/RelA/SpoT-type nucleotidyltranferase